MFPEVLKLRLAYVTVSQKKKQAFHSAHKFVTKKPPLTVTVSVESVTKRLSWFVMLKQTLGRHKFEKSWPGGNSCGVMADSTGHVLLSTGTETLGPQYKYLSCGRERSGIAA
jgi:hypothetical protein